MSPTRVQLSILKLLAAGAKLEAPATPTGRFRLLVKGVTVAELLRRTVWPLFDVGWIDADLKLTSDGRARAEVGTFVRAFTEQQA